MRVETGQRLFAPFRWLVVAAGGAVCVHAALGLPAARLDLRFALLALVTVAGASRITVRIPGINGHITVSETFVFLMMLLYDGEAAVLLAAADVLTASSRISRKPSTYLFNSAAMACATFATVHTMRLLFGPLTSIPAGEMSGALISAVCVMALVQYLASTGLVAVAQAWKLGEPVWQVWSKYCLWSSITYFAGASAAAIVVKLIDTVGFYSLLIAAPIIGIIYLTYRTYLKNIEAMAAAAKAEQSDRHIKELSHHIAEQERISRALQESEEHFRHAAFHDPLTGLPNRAMLTEQLRLTVERAKHSDEYQFAVLFLDLDRFKYVNDSLGHTAGDQLLVTFARRLESCLRATDMVARLGGDEFAVLLDGIKGPDDATETAERIQRAVASPFSLRGLEVFTSTSIGIALSRDCYDRPDDILRDADIAMYRAKEKGKACHEVFTRSMYVHAVSRLNLENDLRRAVERGEFLLHYQPIVSLETGRITGFEALARWPHHERGLVPPDEFIPAAEETGLIMPLGEWVLREACRQVREWQWRSPANRPLTLNVNLSGKQFAQPDLVEQIESILRETDFDPRCLRLEITESAVMKNAEAAVAMLRQLRALGVQLNIDDFGTGYSSLSYLHRFPVNALKIDRSFVGRMGVGDEDAEIVRTIITLARNLGMEVVAEGVETDGQLGQLNALGCEFAQGYLFSRPLDATAAGLLLDERPHWNVRAADKPHEETRTTTAPAYTSYSYLKSV